MSYFSNFQNPVTWDSQPSPVGYEMLIDQCPDDYSNPLSLGRTVKGMNL